MHPHRPRREAPLHARSASAAAAGALCLALLSACGSSTDTSAGSPSTPITIRAGDFAADPAPSTSPTPAPAARPAPATTPPAAPRSIATPSPVGPRSPANPANSADAADAASDPAAWAGAPDRLDLRAIPGPPDLGEAPPPLPDGEMVLDAVVGRINGRPIYASQYLGPRGVGPRLRALADQGVPEPRWRAEAIRLIRDLLIAEIRDELLLAEARLAIPPEARAGLFAFMDQIRSEVVSQNYGSESLAQRRLLDDLDRTLDEQVAAELDRRLMASLLRQRIDDRINLTRRDVQIEYDRLAQQPLGGTVTMRVILVRRGDRDAVTHFESALASGEDFAALAADERNGWRPPEGERGLHRVNLEDNAEDTPYFSTPTLDEAAKALSPGETTPAIDVGPLRYWVHLESVDRPALPSLYDAQLDIEADLRARRREEERRRYFTNLLEQGRISDEEVSRIIRRLVEIAAERYLPRES